MYQLLINEKYIASNTTFSIFNGIFDEPKFKQPVVWTKKQSQLIYFVHSAFKADNPLDVGVKCLYCFRLQNEKVPNRQNMVCVLQKNRRFHFNFFCKRMMRIISKGMGDPIFRIGVDFLQDSFHRRIKDAFR